MKKWRVTYPDGTDEEVTGNYLEHYNGVLNLLDYHGRTTRSWPLTSVRSWTEIS